jgi:hypothetical protein
MTIPDPPERRFPVGNTEMTRQAILEALEANIGFAKDNAADLLSYLGRQPANPERAHVVQGVQRIQGYLGGVLLQMVGALLDDDNEQRQLG